MLFRSDDSNTEIDELTANIKEIESALTDSDLGTIGTLEKHIEAYDKLKGALTGQLDLQDNLKEEALQGLEQILDIFKDEIPGFNLANLTIDGEVDPAEFNKLINFAKEKINEFNKELAMGGGSEKTEAQIKIYEDLIKEVDKYKDAITKSGSAIGKINDTLDKTREKQQKYYKTILQIGRASCRERV